MSRFSVALLAAAFVATGCRESKADCQGAAISCGGTCYELRSDNLNCGACGNACAAGTVCSNGACAVDCAAGLVNCDGRCIDPQTDLAFCGASGACSTADSTAGTACGSGQFCSAGACVQKCSAAQTACPASSPTYCADLTRDANNCGSCGYACPLGQQCVTTGDVTACQCPSARPDACGTGAAAVCTNRQNDPQNCGACGTTCGVGQACVNGQCSTLCPTGQVNCGDGVCRVLATDSAMCGTTCGNAVACTGGLVCSGGQCTTSCPTGQVDCGDGVYTPIASSSFAGTEDPLSEGGTWANMPSLTGGTGIRVAKAGFAYSKPDNGNHAGARSTATLSSDQYTLITIQQYVGGQMGPTVRTQASGGAQDSHYLWWVGSGGPYLYRIDANGTTYSSVGITPAPIRAAVSGDTVRLVARGNAIIGYLNGTRVAWAWDSTYPSGSSGVLFFPGGSGTSTGNQMSYWEAGNAPSLASGSGSGTNDSSNFTGPDETEASGIYENDRWYPTEMANGVGVVQRVSNHAVGSAGGHNFAAAWSISPPNKQYSQVTFGAVPGGSGGGPMVRMARGSRTGYLLFIYNDSATIYKWTGGNNFVGLGGTPVTITSGDTWGLYADGSSLDVKKNGVSIGAPFPITDTDFPSGDVGIEIFNGYTFSAWQGGAF